MNSTSSPYTDPAHHSSSRPTLGFPLGTALLLIVVFSLSGIFSCCYHWDKLRSLRRSFHGDPDNADPEADDAHDHQHPIKPKPTHMDSKQKENESLPVIMAGDRMPKFMAMPCPCEPPRAADNLVLHVQKPPKDGT